MANSRDRRKLQRMLREAGLPLPQKPPSPPQLPISEHPLKRIPKWIYVVLVGATLLVTLFEGVPWLSIQPGDSLNPLDPYATMFSVSNGGYVPLTDLTAECNFGFNANATHALHFMASDDTAIFPHFATWLWHDGRATVPCFDMLKRAFGDNFYNFGGAHLQVKITYSFMGLNAERLRRSQTFDFRAIAATDRSQHWEYIHKD
jgi:hypothetical protein